MNYYQAALGSVLVNKSVNIGIIPTLISKSNTKRKTILIQNTSTTVTLLIGKITLTSSTGFEIPPTESLKLYNKEDIYGITASGTCDVRYLESKRT